MISIAARELQISFQSHEPNKETFQRLWSGFSKTLIYAMAPLQCLSYPSLYNELKT